MCGRSKCKAINLNKYSICYDIWCSVFGKAPCRVDGSKYSQMILLTSTLILCKSTNTKLAMNSSTDDKTKEHADDYNDNESDEESNTDDKKHDNSDDGVEDENKDMEVDQQNNSCQFSGF